MKLREAIEKVEKLEEQMHKLLQLPTVQKELQKLEDDIEQMRRNN